MKRSLVMLASDFDPKKFKLAGSFMSEKLDGVRALWLPFTRGKSWREFSFANITRDTREYKATGLWTRRGKPILAPDWFLDRLPGDVPLDGELFAGRGKFQRTTSIVRKLIPVTPEWDEITYVTFDIPSYSEIFRTGQIREGGTAGDPAYEVFIRISDLGKYDLSSSPYLYPRRFTEVLHHLRALVTTNRKTLDTIDQIQLPFSEQAAASVVDYALINKTGAGAEGLMLRRGHTMWEPIRSLELVKVKPLMDSEATVIGYTYGKGKLRGKIGAFRVQWGDHTFDLSGFTEAEREIDGEFNPNMEGEYTEANLSQQFPLGSQVTFKYNDQSRDGIPKFARFWRKAVA